MINGMISFSHTWMATSYKMYIHVSQIIRFARASSRIRDFDYSKEAP